MKKAFLLASILFISVISTACINNYAVQELNNKAKDFMDKGDYISAIERLKSSIDLDATVFETQYNLAVAYTKAEDYANAIKTYNDAIKLNPDFADAYYSLAVCEENLAKDIISGDMVVEDEQTIIKAEDLEDSDEDNNNDKKVLTDVAKQAVVNLLNSAVSDYEIYMDKTTSDTSQISDKIEELKLLAETYEK